MAALAITFAPESIDLTTAARIAILRDYDVGADPRADLIAAAITEVSGEITDYLGMHTLRAERVEDFELSRHEKVLTLTGIDVDVTADAVTVVTSSTYTGLDTATAMVNGTDYIVRPRQGTIRFIGSQPRSPAYVRVTYTGGLFVDADEIGTKHLWATTAAEKQIVYRLQRLLTLGGNLSVSSGGSTSFVDEYRMLKTVSTSLKAHRRIYI